MKSQMVGEDFIIGFILFFLLATTVFLFINGGGGSNIDFFNTSIYQEDVFLMDYVYINGYDLNTEVFDPSKIVISATFNPYSVTSKMEDQGLNISFDVGRTGFPAGDYDESIMSFPIKYSVSWDDFDPNEGFINPSVQGVESKTYKYDLFNVTNMTVFQGVTIYPDCQSNITVKAELVSNDFNETVLFNNEYNILVNFCVFQKTDLSINSFSLTGDIANMTVSNLNNNVSFNVNIYFFNKTTDELIFVDNNNIKFQNQTGEWNAAKSFTVTENSQLKISFNLNDFYLGETKLNKCADFIRFKTIIQSMNIQEYSLNNNDFEQTITGCP